MSDRYFADLDIHGEVIRFYPDDGKTRLHQNDARRIPVESVTFVRESAIAEAVAAERERHLQFLEEIKKMQTSIKEHIEAIRSAAK